jgi:hypothetical protein
MMKYSIIIKALVVVVILSGCVKVNAQGAFEDEYGNRYDYHRSPIYYPQEEEEDDPGTGEEGGGTVEDPETPVDAHLIYLALAGIIFAGTYQNKKPRCKKNGT